MIKELADELLESARETVAIKRGEHAPSQKFEIK